MKVYTIKGEHSSAFFFKYRFPYAVEYFRSSNYYATVAVPDEDVDYNNEELYALLDSAVFYIDTHVENNHFSSRGRYTHHDNYNHRSFAMFNNLSVRRWYRSLAVEHVNFSLRNVYGMYGTTYYTFVGCPLNKGEEVYEHMARNVAELPRIARFRYNPALTTVENINILKEGKDSALP